MAVTTLRYVSLLAQERCTKEGRPDIRVSLRETSLAPVPLRGLAYMGHPWPIKRGRHRYLAASMRLALLRNTSTRPPEGGQVASLQDFLELKLDGVCFCFQAAITQATPKSPSGGRMESPRKGLSDMDVARATMGQGWPFVAGPWRGDGMREPRRSRGRMAGCPSLWLLSLGQARESDSPVRGETHQAKRRAKLCAVATRQPVSRLATVLHHQ